MRILLDTNILVRAHARARGPARELLGIITSGPHVLVASPFLLAEVTRVLNYPRLQVLWGLTPDEIRDFVEQLYACAEIVDPGVGVPGATISRDPDDDPIIRAAEQGQVEVLCTRDAHICGDPNVQRYCAERGIRIMTEVELLELLRSV